jgi:4-amino-4-deoxy-L-arabinose transferase-like glycosyltransferase
MHLSSTVIHCFALYLGVFLCLSGIILHNYQKTNIAVAVLCLGSFLLFSYFALLDPYLNLWDERFHALVAKNLLQHPLMPTLYDDPAISMSYNRWDRAIIWLHKQPFFLWQITVCYKIFGISEYTTRLPSIISGSLLILLSYRTGRLLINKDVGFYTAFLFATSYYLAELISGRFMVDHNDVSFLFYISASIWAWIEYISSGKKRWIILIGLFSGIAILCKWLVGLAVYSGWFVYLLCTNYQKKTKSTGNTSASPLLVALLITITVFLPWQLLIFHWYPAEALFTLKENNVHFTTVVEGHGGPWWFYFDNIRLLYGTVVLFLLPFALIIAVRKIKSKSLAIAFFAIPLVVYILFSLSKTKMPGFTFVASLPILLTLGSLLDYLIIFLRGLRFPVYLKRLSIVVCIVLIGIFNLKFSTISENHSLSGDDKLCSRICIRNKTLFESLRTSLPSNSVVFNLKGRTYIECMFYSGLPAYNFIPTAEQHLELKKKNKIVVIFILSDQNLPRYLKEDNSIIIMRYFLQACDV